MLKLEDFNQFEIDSTSAKSLIGGWVDIIFTSTGTIIHKIDEKTGDEEWQLHPGDGNYAVDSSPQDWARDGDVG